MLCKYPLLVYVTKKTYFLKKLLDEQLFVFEITRDTSSDATKHVFKFLSGVIIVTIIKNVSIDRKNVKLCIKSFKY